MYIQLVSRATSLLFQIRTESHKELLHYATSSNVFIYLKVINCQPLNKIMKNIDTGGAILSMRVPFPKTLMDNKKIYGELYPWI